MKNIIIIASLLLGMPLMAQTKVVKKNAVKANNFGITYSLPKTSLVVDAEVTKVTCKAGPYYQYAEKYLGVKDAVTEDKVYFDLGKISLINRGLPDADNTYIVSGNENVEDMYEDLKLPTPQDIDATTVSGYVTELMDKIPEAGEKVEVDDIEIEVTKASAKHVQEVKVTVKEKTEDDEDKDKSLFRRHRDDEDEDKGDKD